MPAQIEIIRAEPQTSSVFFEIKSTVRKREKSFYTWFTLWSDGKWHLGKEEFKDNQWRLVRDYFQDHSSFEPATESFKNETLAALEAAIQPWFAEQANQDRLAAKKKKDVQESIEATENRIKIAEQELAEMRLKLTELKIQLSYL